VCIGQGQAPGEPACEDTCFGEVCISSTAGVVLLGGTWTPGVTEFVQDGFKKLPGNSF
jgi:hypothetical protein